nr:hypothetical protein [Halomonas elongata]
MVTNNLFIKPKFENRSLASKSWNAIFFSNFGSETNNKNSVKSVVVAGNSFINKSETQPAIQFRQYGNGVNPTTGKEMTNSEKISKSNITIMDNTFSNCNIHSFPYWNGIEISRNRFYGKSGNGYIEISKNCGGWRIVENFFERKNHIVLPPSLNKELAWPRFTIAENFARGAVNIENEDIIGKQYNYFTHKGQKS